MTFFVGNKSIHIGCRKIVFRRHWIFFPNINKVLGYLFLFRIFKILFLYSKVLSKSNNIYAFSMLWHAKIHRVHDFGVRDNVSNLIQCI